MCGKHLYSTVGCKEDALRWGHGLNFHLLFKNQWGNEKDVEGKRWKRSRWRKCIEIKDMTIKDMKTIKLENYN